MPAKAGVQLLAQDWVPASAGTSGKSGMSGKGEDEQKRAEQGTRSAHVERLGALRLAGSVERDLLDARLGLLEQFLAAALERFAALVDRDRFLERHLAFLEPLDDGL